jgi:PhnB protein
MGHQPPGRRAVIPRINTPDVSDLVTFVKEVFDAGGDYRLDQPSELMIGDSAVMISDGGGLRPPTAAFLYVYVPDADESYRRAMGAGATSIEAPLDTPYGDRRATIQDRWGNLWQIATHRGGSV